MTAPLSAAAAPPNETHLPGLPCRSVDVGDDADGDVGARGVVGVGPTCAAASHATAAAHAAASASP